MHVGGILYGNISIQKVKLNAGLLDDYWPHVWV